MSPRQVENLLPARPKIINDSIIETQDPVIYEKRDFSWENKSNIELNYWVLLTIPLLVIIVFFIDIRKKKFSLKEKKELKALNFPCYQCKYFNQNPYLKCAVNPELALTQDSYECQSFQQHNNLKN